jgi:hypothetical protein
MRVLKGIVKQKKGYENKNPLKPSSFFAKVYNLKLSVNVC